MALIYMRAKIIEKYIFMRAFYVLTRINFCGIVIAQPEALNKIYEKNKGDARRKSYPKSCESYNE